MYKVFIVDDEEFVIKSLIRSVNWKEYGFEVIASSNDGIDAYEEIIRLKPHIVFTDIRMPGMNGLELIKNAKRTLNSTLFVVISGYAEFAYAQKALNYGAIGYCLKPFDDDEISGLLKKARALLDNSNNDELDIVSTIEEQNPESKLKISELLSQKGMEIENGIAAAVSYGNERIRFKPDIDHLSIKTGSSKYLYFFSGFNKSDYDKAVCEVTYPEIKGVGISEIFYSIDDLKKNIDEATVLAYQFFITGEQGVFTRNEEVRNLPESIMKDFEKIVSKMDIEAVEKFLDNLEEYFKQGALNIKYAMSIYNVYITFSSHFFGIDRYDDYIYSFDQLCSMFRSVNEMGRFIKEDMYNSLRRNEGVAREEIKNEYFKRIVDYVNQNFYKDISVQSLSKEFVINSNYISQLFRKNTGMTFTDYITKLRIDYSRELLQKTNFSIDEVATKCGYTDYFYFIRVFKKITGQTPGQFRHLGTGHK